MTTEQKKRFAFEGVSPEVAKIARDFVAKHNLDDRIEKADFILPDDTNLDAAERFLVEFIGAGVAAGNLSDLAVTSILQRVVWMSAEIGSLKRANRNLRSKNLRLKRATERKPGTQMLINPMLAEPEVPEIRV